MIPPGDVIDASHDFQSVFQQFSPVQQHLFRGCSDAVTVPKGSFVYHQDELADAIYFIEKGVVEVLAVSPDKTKTRRLNYLTRGDIFGEIGSLLGKPRVASIRACEDLELRRVRRNDFLTMLEKIPKLGIFISVRLSHRLYAATVSASYNSYCIDLSGSLQNFDLLIVFQTISNSARTGELRLLNPNNDMFGYFFFRNGNVENGQLQHLHGIEAVWELFLARQPEGTFAFQIADEPSVSLDPGFGIQMDGMDLLMQAAGKRDHFQAMPEEMRNLQGKLTRVSDALDWNRPDHAAEAAHIWKLIQKRGQHLEALWRQSNLSVFTLAEIVSALVQSGQASFGMDNVTGSVPPIP